VGTDVGFGVVVDVKPPGRGARSRSSGVVPAPGKGWMLSAAAISGASLLEGDSRKGTSIGVESDVREIEEFVFWSFYLYFMGPDYISR